MVDNIALSQAVIDTISQAIAPSTKQAYALKWGLFVDWCSSCREKEKLERKLSRSTLKARPDQQDSERHKEIKYPQVTIGGNPGGGGQGFKTPLSEGCPPKNMIKNIHYYCE